MATSGNPWCSFTYGTLFFVWCSLPVILLATIYAHFLIFFVPQKNTIAIQPMRLLKSGCARPSFRRLDNNVLQLAVSEFIIDLFSRISNKDGLRLIECIQYFVPKRKKVAFSYFLFFVIVICVYCWAANLSIILFRYLLVSRPTNSLGELDKLVTDDSRVVHEMRKTGETREKKRLARDYVKIIYRCFTIRLFSCAVILSLIAWETPFVSYIYHFYREMVRDMRHEKSVLWSSIKNMK